MKIVFLSNYYNHHQSALSEALFNMQGIEYYFIETSKMDEEQKKLGYRDDGTPDFVKKMYVDDAECIKLINQADVLIFGSAPRKYLYNRLIHKKPIFFYSERYYKSGISFIEYLKAVFGTFIHNTLLRKSPFYMLCASAYTPCDCFALKKIGKFNNKLYKWGYFPEVKKFDIDELMKIKAKKEMPLILWAGRFLEWKHPEIPIMIANDLKKENRQFKMALIGIGPLENKIAEMIQIYHLEDCVSLVGSMPPEDVRTYMENADIYLATSDYNEGWGAVVNESMSSGCAVVASHAMGSVPFLIQHKLNGLIYESGNYDEIFRYVKYLLDNPQERIKIGKSAYSTMLNEWNAEVAAFRFVQLSKASLEGDPKMNSIFTRGVCSIAEVIPQDAMYNYLVNEANNDKK